jgi:hypothetical protein
VDDPGDGAGTRLRTNCGWDGCQGEPRLGLPLCLGILMALRERVCPGEESR